ncbi:DNA ligase D [Pseudomonas sp. GV071]|uniref:DNA ligase D n=1 Tax=Pseudomonas sp. GV071 TaxID=2135754 RepID=UPI000D3A43C1|nr:DNA ligase D [Pseudomonas sp. GV071]PTQ69198.1 ATP-dependent DNA ligase LigD phosphoesterase module /ATP-dependent DNA ligase LigD polymerase module [Pseudomonas sp. GV071]
MSEYNRKRNFSITSEPPESTGRKPRKSPGALRFVIQKHDASHLHYDFRLELDGTLKSWAIPKGPSLDPKDKRLAVHVEDHPLGYANFEGSIPKGQYGAGDVIVWDQGVWQPQGNPLDSYKSGKLKFTLVGEKLSGDWALVRTRLKGSGDKEQWLLIKEQDDVARPASEYSVVDELPKSVLSGGEVGTAKKAASKPAKAKAKSTGKVSAADTQAANHPHGEIPEKFQPQLATLVTQPPAGEWIYEIKFDGYRMLARIQGGEVRMFSRNGNDWTERLPKQVEALRSLQLGDSWLDGEVVVLNEEGLPDFQGLQNAFDEGQSQPILYYLFDAPYLNGQNLRQQPLEARRDALQKVLKHKRGPLRFSKAFTASHQDIVASACAMRLEGVVGKRANSPYVSRRSDDWIKLKCRQRQEFVVIGYTEPKGSRSAFGALLLGVYEDDKLRYAGRVGTGFDEQRLQHLLKQMEKLQRADTPLAKPLSAALARGVQWLKPTLVGEVEFAEWTREGLVRQASFIAERTDKPARQIIREQAVAPPSTSSKPSGKTKAKASAASKQRQSLDDVSISHPERVIDAQSGTQKVELAQFYHDIGRWILPHLQGRPVSLMRAPDGVEGEQFFQKHAQHLAIPHITHLDKKIDPGHAQLMQIDSLPALIGAVQMGCIELHTWGAGSATVDKPDRLILDLDPDPALPWRSMVEATNLTLAVLDELGLQAWLKTSGGKGMHIVVPLRKQAGWDSVKAFSKALATFMTQQIPERFTDKMGPQNRVGKIFVDYLRNQRGASTASAYSVRARPGLPVSVPIRREELDDLKNAAQWTVDNLRERLDSLEQDPWHDYHNRQRITRAQWKKLGAKPV